MSSPRTRTAKAKSFSDLSPAHRAEVISWLTDRIDEMKIDRAFIAKERPGLFDGLQATLQGLKEYDRAVKAVRPLKAGGR